MLGFWDFLAVVMLCLVLEGAVANICKTIQFRSACKRDQVKGGDADER